MPAASSRTVAGSTPSNSAHRSSGAAIGRPWMWRSAGATTARSAAEPGRVAVDRGPADPTVVAIAATVYSPERYISWGHPELLAVRCEIVVRAGVPSACHKERLRVP
jgi:hypothetical protein